MADFRLSAQVIGRSAGRTATACAAYRASERVQCERTGLTHDYSRKGGTLHTEIMTPDNTPEWMRNRAQLWNAVEKVERRKDAQLAREVQLSLPHELNQEHRLELVRGFVADQFVSKGMIADVAIHAPNEKGDERNHHAHVMLTMRDITADGFGNKNRDWNKSQVLENWREQWAHHQNRELERHGHAERVDHRSYEDQGISKQPQQHRGNVANEMEQREENSRIGNDNRKIVNDNLDLAELEAKQVALSAQIALEKANLREWSESMRDKFERSVKATTHDRQATQTLEKLHLEEKLSKESGNGKIAINEQINDLNYKLSRSFGLRGLIRNITGQNKRDIASLNVLEISVSAIIQSENIRRENLTTRHHEENRQAERQALEKRASVNSEIIKARDQLQENIEKREQQQAQRRMARGKNKFTSSTDKRKAQLAEDAIDNKRSFKQKLKQVGNQKTPKPSKEQKHDILDTQFSKSGNSEPSFKDRLRNAYSPLAGNDNEPSKEQKPQPTTGRKPREP